MNGLRNSKTINNTTTTYYWLDGSLEGQKTGEEYLFFLHDEAGTIYGFVVKNGTQETTYYYDFNLQGDVVGIIDTAGTKVVEYSYDVWGVPRTVTGTLADTIGQKNPIRYRGYYYDAETGFYYLQSRYYDPEIGRFINADGYVSTGQGITGYNMFAYCNNNPVNLCDCTGQSWAHAFANTIKQGAGYFLGAAAVSQLDTIMPGVADLVAGVMLIGGVIVCAGIATYMDITAPTPTISIPKTEEKAEDNTITKKPDDSVKFPVNPNNFNPVGLVKVPRNGR